MKIIIVGAGKVGYYLVKTLLSKNYEVSVIEMDEKRSRRIVEEFDILSIMGDGSNINILADAGADTADVVAAVTGSDEENLLVCQMAKRKFSVNKTVARINNPKNERIFKELGVDIAISSTSLIAKSIEFEMETDNMKVLLNFERGDVSIIELEMQENSPAAGQSIKELAMTLPNSFVFISIFRGKDIIFPKGETIIQPNDKVIALVSSENRNVLNNTLLGKRRTGLW
jgi:trk system potassium uptake protein TrkA